MLIRQAVECDVEAVVRITAESETAPQWTRAQIAEVVGEERGNGLLKREMLVVVEDGDVVGFAVATVLTSVYPVEAELESIAVSAERRGVGLGRALLDAVLGWAQERGAAELRLEVRASNEAARGLYRRMGLREDGVRPGYYANPSEDAVCMVRTIRAAAATG